MKESDKISKKISDSILRRKKMDKKISKGLIGYEKQSASCMFGKWTCLSCYRKIPGHHWITKNGCRWCDSKYWRDKK